MKKRSLSFLLALSLILMCLPANACRASKTYTLSYYEYFDTYCTVTLYAITEEKYQAAKVIVDEHLMLWHRYTDIYHEYPSMANICTVNASGGRQITVSNELGDFLKYAVSACALSLGTVNIAMGAVTSLWHTAMETGVLPSQEALSEAGRHVSVDNLVIGYTDNGDCLVSLTDPLCRLDVGALAKGYTAGLLYQRLLELGLSDFLINLGGAITTHGRPVGSGRDFFRLGIVDAESAKDNPDTKQYITPYIEVKDCGSVITSGNYLRYFEVDGQRYNHIIDPATLQPAGRYDSVSVILDNSHNDPVIGDLLSTALFILNQEDGINLAGQFNATVIYQINGQISTY